ncbi:rhodanese domain-containing protein [Candidatus Magnetoovum chiemensis]|nr:rhodanese domain-containing protein [Candidatus Magnetoovum chiemensis]
MITGKENIIGAIIEAYAMEKGTADFYNHLEIITDDPALKELFNTLKTWENAHISYLSHLYKSLMDERETITFEQFSQELPSTHIESGIPLNDAFALFNKKDITITSDAIKLALEIEGKAYNLYRELSQKAADTNAKVIFSDMMTQEKKHIEQINNYKKQGGV